MVAEGRGGELLIPGAASSPRGLGRHLVIPSKGLKAQQQARGAAAPQPRPAPCRAQAALPAPPARAGLRCQHVAVPPRARRIPMRKQHRPGVPWWRQLLRTGCWQLLSLSRTALQGLQWLWRLLWYLLICSTSCWDIAFQFAEELLSVDHGTEGSEEEEDGTAAAALEPGQTVLELQQLRDANEAALGRLEALEADVRFLCTELGAEKLLWSSRFLELLREQQGLRQRHGQRSLGNQPASSLSVAMHRECPGTRIVVTESSHRHLSQAGGAVATEGLQNPSTAPFTSFLDEYIPSISIFSHMLQLQQVPSGGTHPGGTARDGTWGFAPVGGREWSSQGQPTPTKAVGLGVGCPQPLFC
ncbi:uncharacterized protein LOC110387291 [Numida meleagris]|uniref:uncharacterized protein LOC110387291 n=1 Tax=Numida meleagris TaxID=8996 RepID=UPI000B3E3286|nr:uncharacterized protein LOC110387291 [Numida meleagris]